ncbi:MAG: acylphosphatase [Candidatus Omnitrophota bacterium]
MSVKRIEVFYSGLVQGVGFRFSIERLASKSGIKGFVRNLSDGRVEIIAEGKEEDLKVLLDNIDKNFKSYIRKVAISWLEPTGEFKEFGIEF